MLAQIATLLGVSPDDLIDASGVTLKDLRTAGGLRQRDISAILGVAPSTYCDVERSRQNIPPRWIPVLAEALGKTESTLRDSLGFN